MANRAYLRIWTRDFSEATMIPEFARFLTTAPLSASQTAFTELHVQPVDSTETAVAQWDLREQGYGPPEVAALAAQKSKQQHRRCGRRCGTDAAHVAVAPLVGDAVKAAEVEQQRVAASDVQLTKAGDVSTKALRHPES